MTSSQTPLPGREPAAGDHTEAAEHGSVGAAGPTTPAGQGTHHVVRGAANTTEKAQVTIEVGDAARLWLGPPKQGRMCYGVVVGVDNLGHSGIQIWFTQPAYKGSAGCYATHAEVEVQRERVVLYWDGSESREVEVDWFREGPIRPVFPPGSPGAGS